jgi:hypothetical protein
MRWLRRAFALTGFFILAAAPGSAQTTTGTVRGVVRDQNGTPLADAEVQARNPETGITRSATTNSEGAFALPGLAPGTYDLTARHIGNSPQARRVVVQIGATLLADFSLQAGAVEVAGVTVEAAPALDRSGREQGQPIPAQCHPGVPRHQSELQGGISESLERNRHGDHPFRDQPLDGQCPVRVPEQEFRRTRLVPTGDRRIHQARLQPLAAGCERRWSATTGPAVLLRLV